MNHPYNGWFSFTKKHAPASSKARVEYLLHGKAYCGKCGSRLVGDCGTGRGDVIYNYYACGKRKKHRSCDKLNEKKGFLEWYVVEQTVEYVLLPERMEYIAERMIETYNDEFGAARIRSLEQRIRHIDGKVDRLIDTISVSPKKSADKLLQKIETLELQKADIEIDLSKLRIANGIKYTKEQIMAWMTSFCRGELLDEDFQKRIIDVFINSVFVYDDKIVIYYNVHEGKQVSFMEMLDSTQEPPNCNAFGGSDLGVLGGRWWIRTTEVTDNRFTVCPLWPLG